MKQYRGHHERNDFAVNYCLVKTELREYIKSLADFQNGKLKSGKAFFCFLKIAVYGNILFSIALGAALKLTVPNWK